MLASHTQLESRNSLYFGRWRYVVRLSVPEAWLLSELDPVNIYRRINYRDEFLKIQGHVSLRETGALDLILQVAGDLRALQHEFSHRVMWSQYCHVYTNSTEDVATLVAKYPHSQVREALVSMPADAISLKSQPRFPYRTYFREREIPPAQRQSLQNWIMAQAPDMVPSPVTRQWLDQAGPVRWRHNWCRSHYYVEHAQASHVMMLNLICAGLVRKTMRVLSQP